MSIESPQNGESPRMKEERLRMVKQKEAGQHLTRLVAILMPSVVQSGTSIESLEFESTLVTDGGDGYPESMDESERRQFDKSITALTKGFDRLGLGFAISEHSFAYGYDSESKNAYLNTLANPWDYVAGGKVRTTLDIPRLVRAVNALKEEDKKVEALGLLETLKKMIVREGEESPARYLESLNEPDHEALSELTKMLESIPEEMLVEVERITLESEAKTHPGRAYLKDVMRPTLAIAWKKVYEMSKLEIDRDKGMYPEFWSEHIRIIRVKNAIGAIRHGVVEHDLE